VFTSVCVVLVCSEVGKKVAWLDTALHPILTPQHDRLAKIELGYVGWMLVGFFLVRKFLSMNHYGGVKPLHAKDESVRLSSYSNSFNILDRLGFVLVLACFSNEIGQPLLGLLSKVKQILKHSPIM
jgi:hypothetical protein